MNSIKKHNLYTLLFYVISAEAIGGVSALITGSFSDFFLKYEKPPLMPPGWLFPVVWVILYALMGYSAYLISTSTAGKEDINRAMIVYWGQLLFNFLWSIIFFKAELLWLGFADIVLLLISVIAMAVLFGRIRALAGYINIPYIAWVAFATYLNLATAIIN